MKLSAEGSINRLNRLKTKGNWRIAKLSENFCFGFNAKKEDEQSFRPTLLSVLQYLTEATHIFITTNFNKILVFSQFT